MGCYVNPKNCSKEDWLYAHGQERPKPYFYEWTFEDLKKQEMMMVVLVDNLIFTAAAIGCDEYEFNYFLENDDERPKKWYTVKIKSIVDTLPKESLSPYMNKYF